jgi:hypothetical protein
VGRGLSALVGGLAVTAGLIALYLLAVVGGLTCGGTDTAPVSDSARCDGRDMAVIWWSAFIGMVAVPLVGTGFSIAARDKRGIGIALAVAGVTLASIVIALRIYD